MNFWIGLLLGGMFGAVVMALLKTGGGGDDEYRQTACVVFRRVGSGVCSSLCRALHAISNERLFLRSRNPDDFLRDEYVGIRNTGGNLRRQEMKGR